MTFIVILAILTGMFIGFRRGFLRSGFKLLTAILSIVLSYVLAPIIANWVITYTDWDDSLQTSIATQIENTARQRMKSDAMRITIENITYKINSNKLIITNVATYTIIRTIIFAKAPAI